MSDRARAFWIAEPGRGEIRDEALPPASEGDVRVRALFSGISRGTESLVFTGRVPRSERDRMRAPFQAGDFPAPVKYGYSSVGQVEEGPRDLKGRTVFALYPHQTRYVVPAAAVHVLPADVPPGRGVLAANLETALNGVWDAGITTGDQVTVIGGGAVGCLVAWIASGIPGTRVELVDINPGRREIGQALGVMFAEPSRAARESGIVVHTSGSQEGLELALELARFEGTIVEMSWFGDRRVSLPLGQDFHSRRLTIKASQVGHVAASHRPQWDTRRRMAHALSLLADPRLDALITGESDFEDLPGVMSRLASSGGDAICHRIRYSQEQA